MRRYFLSLLIISCIIANAQTKTGGDITASGQAKMKVKPDIAEITLRIEKVYTNESIVLKDLNEEADKLTKLLSRLGFTKDQVKVLNFSVSNNDYESTKLFKATNSLIVRFPLDKKVIDNVYSSIEAEKLSNISVDLETRLSDTLERSLRARLVNLAIKDAQQSADNIAKALGVKIGKVKQVSKYGNSLYDLNASGASAIKFTPAYAAIAVPYKTSFDNYDVVEIEIEEQITIIFEIAD